MKTYISATVSAMVCRNVPSGRYVIIFLACAENHVSYIHTRKCQCLINVSHTVYTQSNVSSICVKALSHIKIHINDVGGCLAFLPSSWNTRLHTHTCPSILMCCVYLLPISALQTSSSKFGVATFQMVISLWYIYVHVTALWMSDITCVRAMIY